MRAIALELIPAASSCRRATRPRCSSAIAATRYNAVPETVKSLPTPRTLTRWDESLPPGGKDSSRAPGAPEVGRFLLARALLTPRTWQRAALTTTEHRGF